MFSSLWAQIDTFLKDPLTEEDKRHEQELQRWYQNDTDVKKRQENSSAEGQLVNFIVYIFY